MCSGSNGGNSPGKLNAWLSAVKTPCNAAKLHGVTNAIVTNKSYQALPCTNRRYCAVVHIVIAPSIQGATRLKPGVCSRVKPLRDVMMRIGELAQASAVTQLLQDKLKLIEARMAELGALRDELQQRLGQQCPLNPRL